MSGSWLLDDLGFLPDMGEVYADVPTPSEREASKRPDDMGPPIGDFTPAEEGHAKLLARLVAVYGPAENRP